MPPPPKKKNLFSVYSIDDNDLIQRVMLNYPNTLNTLEPEQFFLNLNNPSDSSYII